jgi:hypothetical protein
MKKVIVILICIIPIQSIAQTADVDLSNQISYCESEFDRLDSEIDNLLSNIIELTSKGDSDNMKIALDIVNNPARADMLSAFLCICFFTKSVCFS